jgi:hypothetical protein
MPDRRRKLSGARRATGAIVGLALGLALGLGTAACPALADEADSFTVRDVQVDVTAENVNVARQQAFAKGQRDALDRLVQRFTTPDEAARLPVASDADLDDMVLDVGVDQEKRSTVRYIATLSVRFKPDAVRRMLKAAGVSFVEWRGPPMAILPVLKTDSGPILWENPNPWRDAWKSSAAQGLVPLVVPAPPPAGQAPDDALQAATAGPDILAALMRRAVGEIAAAVNTAYKTDNAVPAGEASSLSVMVPLGGLSDWTALREKLTRTPAVRGWEVGAISRTSASLVLHYVGDQQQLEAALVQNGLVLSWAEDHWLLQVALTKPAAVSQ